MQKKILVVDDTEATRYAVARTLKAEGFEILEAANGEEALRLALAEKPDLVTLDIHLPDILGFEVCRQIKSHPQTAHIPVLQVSASYITSKDRIHGLEGGADSYLTHPFEPAVLVATVKSLLRSRQLSEELRMTEEKFRLALRNAPILIYTMDKDLRINWIYNQPKSKTPQDFIGKSIFEVLPAEQAEALQAYQQKALQTGQGQRCLLEMAFAEEPRTYDTTIELLHREGDISGLTIACVDVTERIESEKAQQQALEEAELASQAKTRFLSNMSHEIRTPLGIVQGFADLALDNEVSAEDRNEYLLTIKRNASGLTKLLGEILDLAKIEAGRIEIEKTRFSFPNLVEEVLSALSLQAREKAIALRFRVEGAFPEFVESDPTRLRQILLNLTNNALKFTERGGVEITARAWPRSSDASHVHIEVAVRDTGIGLSPEQQARLFQPFVQADSSTTRKYGGTGLGLNLSKRLSQALGGDLILSSSKPGHGSTFKFTFDAGVIEDSFFIDEFLEFHGDRNEDPDLLIKNNLQGMCILLVEDSPDLQVLCRRYLKNCGAKVDLARDGVEGVEKARRKKYDAIIMDVQMPNLDGEEATRILRREGIDTPIIALTAHAWKEDRKRGLEQGFTAYLTKPLNPNLLLETVSRFRSSEVQ